MINLRKQQILNDKKYRSQIKMFEIKYYLLKSLIFNKIYITGRIRYNLLKLFLFLFFFRNNKIYKLKNYCTFTGKHRSIIKKFKFSRFMIKKLGLIGLIFGLEKSSF
jgi:ribosomal protein S14